VIRVREIIVASASLAGLQADDLLARDQRREISRPRSRAMFLARRLRPEISYPAIGRIFADRDHTTVQHSERAVQARLDAGDNQERADICATLAHLGLPQDVDRAAAAVRREQVQTERREALEARRAALLFELGSVERQLAAFAEGAPS
jgi:hypothetical protein